ncbi:MAG: GNAT family N-acetyltransferase [Candidatus Shapirobacteria bacterium]|jgi:GNAT superfamily N-acetyltransferase
MSQYKISQIGTDKVNEFFELYKVLVGTDFKEWSEEAKNKWLTEDYAPEFWNRILNNGCPVLVAYDGDKMVSYIAIEHLTFGVAYLSWMGTLSDYRKKGITRELVAELENWCKQNNIHKIELETQVTELLPYFEKLGFSLEGVRKNSWQKLDNYMFGKDVK